MQGPGLVRGLLHVPVHTPAQIHFLRRAKATNAVMKSATSSQNP